MQIVKKYLNKIKIIDLALLILGVLVVGYFLFSFRRSKETVYLELTFPRTEWNENLVPPEWWQLTEIENGALVYDGMGRNIAQIIKVDKIPWQGGLRTYVDVVLEIEAIFDPRTHKYLLNGQPLLIGNNFSFELENTFFEGKIKNIYLTEEDRYKNIDLAKAEVKVLYREYEAWHAESLRDFILRDDDGQVLVEVEEIKISPAELAVRTDAGSLRKAQHPFKKDVLVTFKLNQVLCIDDICHFKNQGLLIGSGFWLDSGVDFLGGGSIQEVDIIYE